jgi:hypothetical protein
MDKIIITKKIAKQGNNNIIVIPSYLKNMLKSGSIVKVEIEVIGVED